MTQERQGQTDLKAYLQALEEHYNPEIHLIGKELRSPGYHTTLADGQWVHPTRDSLTYAVALLKCGDPALTRRSESIIETVLDLQETDSTCRTYGIWPWFYEEPLSQMNPPDWNWADFCGALLATALHDHADALNPSLAARMREALGHAAWCIFRRNVGPDYTNIAVMGAGVTLAAGEQLGVPQLIQYGRRRLGNLVKYTEFHGDFNEYNSPTYTFTALDEIERILHLVKDETARQDAKWLHRHTWKILADHYHPATGQLAGPHSRSYQDFLSVSRAGKLARLTGADVPMDPRSRPHDPTPPLAPEIRCPEDLIPRFHRLPQETVQFRSRFNRGKTESNDVMGTTWLSHEAAVASINRECTWVQRRPLIAYWPAGAGHTAVFKPTMLKNGKAFSPVMIRCRQEGPRVMTAFALISDLGDYHIFFGRPNDGTYLIHDLRLRFELNGPDACCERLDETTFALSAGTRKAVLHTAEGYFADQVIRWQEGQDDQHAYVDAICYTGEERPFHFETAAPLVLAAGIEVIPSSAPVSTTPIWIERLENDYAATWPGYGLHVYAPLRSERYLVEKSD